MYASLAALRGILCGVDNVLEFVGSEVMSMHDARMFGLNQRVDRLAHKDV
jgi:hypothetical protein